MARGSELTPADLLYLFCTSIAALCRFLPLEPIEFSKSRRLQCAGPGCRAGGIQRHQNRVMRKRREQKVKSLAFRGIDPQFPSATLQVRSSRQRTLLAGISMVRASAVSHSGVRRVNEDRSVCQEALRLDVVADRIRGHAAEVALRRAVESIGLGNVTAPVVHDEEEE